MRKAMLLATALAAIAMVPASVSAQSYGLTQSHVTSSFGLKIVVRDVPKVVQHHYPVRHLTPQPWPRSFSRPAPSWRWGHHAPSWRWGHHAPSWRWGHHAPSWRWHNPWRVDRFHQRGRPGWSPGPGRAYSHDGDWRRVRTPGWGPGAPHRGPHGR